MVNQAVAKPVNNIANEVLERVTEMKNNKELELPANYSAANALKSAYLTLQGVKDTRKRPALEVCSPHSVANALLNMVVQGLSPAKTQCYFIVYGDKLQMQRSYFGTITALKRLESVKDITAQVVHEGDTFQIGSDQNFQTIVRQFDPDFKNQDKEIIAAFARIFRTDGSYVDTIMTKKEIDQSWSQTRQQHNKVQQNFSQEMAKRTVLNRAAKMFINTSDDSDLLAGAINDTTQNEYDYDSEEDSRKDVTPQQEKAKKLADSFNSKLDKQEPAKKEPVEKKSIENKLADKKQNEPKNADKLKQSELKKSSEKEPERPLNEEQGELFGTGTIKSTDEANG